MAFAAVQDHVPMLAWVMLLANVFWSVAYDTEYAMVDRDDDIKIGIRTSALTFGRFDVAAVMFCYAVTLRIYVGIGVACWASAWLYWLGWLAAAGCALYHYTLIRNRERMACFAAFKHNNWLGGALFAGIARIMRWPRSSVGAVCPFAACLFSLDAERVDPTPRRTAYLIAAGTKR